MSRSQLEGRMAWPGYAFAVLLVVVPLLDFLPNVWPVQLGQAGWRYGAVGLFSGFMLTPLLGLALAVGVAALADHQVVVRALAVASVVVAVLIVGACVLFALDALQVRASVQPEARPPFDVGAWRALIKYGLVAGVLAWFGVAGVRGARVGEGRERERARARTPVMVQPPPAS